MSYKYNGFSQTVLKNVSTQFEPGYVYVIMGKSGAGKSTLLFLIPGLDLPVGGEVLFRGKSLKDLNRDEYRAKSVGVIFEGYNLLTNATALENIVLSMNISSSPVKNRSLWDSLKRQELMKKLLAERF